MKEINHECYVSLEVAKLLKKAGFDWKEYLVESNPNSDNDLEWKIPLHIAQKWLRENFKKDIHPILADADIQLWFCHHIDLSVDNSWGKFESLSIKTSFTYEEALEAGIKKALELILEKGK